MDPNADPQPTGCLVILTPLSSGMAEDARVWFAHRYAPAPAPGEGEDAPAEPPPPEPEIRTVPKWAAARFCADELLDGLVNTLAGGYPVPLDVAVIGYRGLDDGTVEFLPLINDIETLTPADVNGKWPLKLVPLADVANLPVEPRRREGDPKNWTVTAEYAGTAPAAAGLAEAYKLVSIWLTGRYNSRPPVVVHLTDGEGFDEHYARVARSLGLLATTFGPARLLHVGLAPGVEPTLCGLWTEEAPAPWAGLFDVSAELPAEDGGRAARRAVSVNDWILADAWSALFDMVPVEDSVAWSAADAGRFDADARGMWTQKMGNEPKQWEDAYAFEPAAGVAAVADGASSGIYCSVWAERLSRRFLADRPDARDPIALNKWVHGLRGEWRAAIDYDKLNWSKQAKVDQVGAAATFLGLEVGPADADGNRPWKACAVGDASLFWVRAGRLLGTFPVVADDQFGSAPLLVRSNAGFKTMACASAGTCRPGDRFFLATDAVAARLLKSVASGPGPDWQRFESIEENAWRAELDVLRKANDMVNDDCTLVVLRVSGGEGLAQPPVDTVQSEGEPEPVAALEMAAQLAVIREVAAESAAPEPAEVLAEAEPIADPILEPVVEAATPTDGNAPGQPEQSEQPDAVGNMPAEVVPEANGTPPNPDPEADERTTTRDGFSDPTDTPV